MATENGLPVKDVSLRGCISVPEVVEPIEHQVYDSAES
jgi:hypothetical protein